MSIKLNIPPILRLLAERKLTNKALAELTGISRQNISTILRRGTCSAPNAGRLAGGLGVAVDQIMEGGGKIWPH